MCVGVFPDLGATGGAVAVAMRMMPRRKSTKSIVAGGRLGLEPRTHGPVSVVPGGSGWIAVRIGVSGLRDSLPDLAAHYVPSFDLSAGRRPGLAHRVDLIRSLSAAWRDQARAAGLSP
jgi:hypothetical protein